MPRDLGDFQTPPELARAILDRLGPIGDRWSRVLEPTCGRGNFIAALLESESPPREIVGLEIQPTYVEEARRRHSPGELFPHTTVDFVRADIFATDLAKNLEWTADGPLLVVGNPPWVTNAELGAMASDNRPSRQKVVGLSGLDAMTGASNFDLAEAVWLKLLTELAEEQPTIALLCKTTVARRVLTWAHNTRLPMRAAELFLISGPRWFKAQVDACLLVVEIGETPPGRYGARVFSTLEDEQPTQVMGVVDGQLVADVPTYERVRNIDGACVVNWRQGVKHDAAALMELTVSDDGELVNKLGEVVDVEAEHLYPLVKGGDLFQGHTSQPSRRVILTQQRLGEETSGLAKSAPRLWRYLQSHRERFERRKSSIYRNQPAFALFGLGPYSFSPFKVAISGLHKTPRFRAIGPVSAGSLNARPVMLDDTCYFAACDSAAEAALLESLLTSDACMSFLNAVIFTDSKRPVTKRLLKRIDLGALLALVGREWLIDASVDTMRRLAPDEREPIARLSQTLDVLWSA